MKQMGIIIVMGSIGAIIGWVTNVFAIRLLFRPYQKKKLPVLNLSLQGLIPKRQKDIAKALASIVSSELITGDDVVKSITREDMKEQLAEKVQKHVQVRVMEKIPFMLPSSIQSMLTEYAGKTVYQEVINFLDNPQDVLKEQELDKIKIEIETIVEEKVLSFDLKQLEELTYTLAQNELKHIEILGGVLGFIIGIIQGVIVQYLM